MEKNFVKNEEGGVAILTAFLIVLLVAVTGMAVDFGRAYLIKTKFQQATDMASIAAATIPIGATDTAATIATNRFNTATRYFNLNYPQKYMGVARPAFTYNYNATAGTLVVNTGSEMNTDFIRTMGFKSLDITAGTSVNIAETNTAIYDVILVMDNSGSMSYSFSGSTDLLGGQTSRMAVLQQAAETMATTLLPAGTTSRIAAVTWNTNVISTMAFTSKVATVNTFLGKMKANGGTASEYGLNWAQTTAKGFNKNSIHVVVLLTDGENNYPNIDNPASLKICNALKALTPPTLVYTIAVAQEASTDTVVKNFLSGCASGNAATNLNQYFFIAPDGPTLESTFGEITNSIQKLRITN